MTRTRTAVALALAAALCIPAATATAAPAPVKRSNPLNVERLLAITEGDSVRFVATMEAVGTDFDAAELAVAVRDRTAPVDSGALDPKHWSGVELDEGEQTTLKVSTSKLTPGDYTAHVAWRGSAGWTHTLDTAYFTVGEDGVASSNELSPEDAAGENGPRPPKPADPVTTPTPSPTGTPAPTPTGGSGTCDDVADGPTREEEVDYGVINGPGGGFTNESDPTECEAPAPAPTPTTGTPAAPPAGVQRDPNLKSGDWYSGAGTAYAVETGQWRGQDLEIANTWQHGGQFAISMDVLKDGNEYGKDKWNLTTGGAPKALIMSISPFATGDGEKSWSAAASGAYDGQWRTQLQNMKSGWGDRAGTFYISLAWELNGNWFKWSVKDGELGDFTKAWARYRDMQREVFPQAQLALTLNKNSAAGSAHTGELIDAVKGEVDALGVDQYNHFSYAGTAAEFAAEQSASNTDDGRGPEGIFGYLDAARDAGVPLIVPEWSGSAKLGDSPAYIQGMYDFFKDNAGPGAGQVAAETQFASDIDDNNWRLSPGTKMPLSGAKYKELFGAYIGG